PLQCLQKRGRTAHDYRPWQRRALQTRRNRRREPRGQNSSQRDEQESVPWESNLFEPGASKTVAPLNSHLRDRHLPCAKSLARFPVDYRRAQEPLEAGVLPAALKVLRLPLPRPPPTAFVRPQPTSWLRRTQPPLASTVDGKVSVLDYPSRIFILFTEVGKEGRQRSRV